MRQVIGRATYIDSTVIGKYSNGKYAKVTDEPIVIENTHPAIIDRATWDAVRRMSKSVRRANSRNGNEGAPLSGLLRCGRCGRAMYAVSGSRCICSSYSTAGKCGYCAVQREPRLKAVAAKIRQHVPLGSRERLEAAIQKQLDRRRTPSVDSKAMAKKLGTLDRQIERASDRLLVVDDSLVPDLEQRLLKLKQQHDQLAAAVNPPAKP